MMNCVSTIVGIVSPCIGPLMDPIKQHMDYIISSTKYVKEMDDFMEQLAGISIDVKKRMESNNTNNLEIPTLVSGWLEKVERIKKDVESISGNRNFGFNITLRYQTGKNALEITGEIKKHIEDYSHITWTNTKIPPARVPTKKESRSASSSPDAQSNFRSRDTIFKEALEFLKQGPNTQVLALCGMGGVGKTTMMEQLKTIAVDKKMFKWVVKVDIGQNPVMFSIQKSIAESFAASLTEDTLSVRADILRKKYEHKLKEGEKILFILDDIWDKVELEQIGLRPLPKGCMLILTSRDENVCRGIAVDAGDNSVLKIVRVPVMEKLEAQNFFWKITNVSEKDDPVFDQIGCEIVRRCGYLPLAIKLIATTLQLENDRSVWENKLDRLKMNDLDENVQIIVEMSYNHLRKHDKDVFLLCGLFPDDFNIPIEDLARYAWGLKLLRNFQTFKAVRNQIHTCVSNLKRVSLLMDSDYVGCVKMHDLVLSYVLGSVSKGDHDWIINHGDTTKMSGAEMNESCERISLTCMGMSEFPIDFNFPNLLMLKLMQGDESLMFPEDFYKKKEKLEVVAYNEIDYPLLPRLLQCSTNLRTLCLDDCLLMFDLSPIGDLMNLEVLSFANCHVRSLPSTIGNLKKLRLLDLTGCVGLRIDEGVLKRLSKLEELYMRVYDKKAISFTDGNSEELAEVSNNLFALEFEFFRNNVLARKMSFKKLERFRISMGCFLERMEEEAKHSIENTLILVTSRSELLESKVNELFEKTEFLQLEVNDLDDFKDILMQSPLPQQVSFYNLRVLHVSNCADLKSLFTVSMANGLKNLEHLIISSCHLLKVLVCIENSKDEVIRFQKLKYLCLEDLPELVSLCDIVNEVELPELVNLDLGRLPKFASIYSKNEGTSSLSSNISLILNKKIVIPKLEKLTIHEMKNLKEIWPCEFNSSEEINACMLREITVIGCNGLVNLFPKNPMTFLHHLESLEVWECGSIEVLFDIDLGCVGEIEQEGHNNLRSIYVNKAKMLTEIWRVKGVNICDHLVSAFQAVESISIRDCETFKNIFTPTTINFDFGALTHIVIMDFGRVMARSKEEEGSNVISKKEISEDNNDNIAFFSSQMLPSFHHLRQLNMGGFIGIDVVFEIHSATNQQLLPNLQHLSLIKGEGMSHIWKWNSNTHQIPPPFLFHNLTTIDMIACNRIKYLLSPLMAKHLINLKNIKIHTCHDIEEVVSSRDEGDKEMATDRSTASFPRLDHLGLVSLECLQRIHGGDLWGASNKVTTSDQHQILRQSPEVDVTSCSFLYHYSKKIYIWDCHELSSVFPSHAVRRIQRLEELELSSCNSMTRVFEIEGVNANTNNVGGESTSFLQLPNLRILSIKSCHRLENIFVSGAMGISRSTNTSLLQLPNLKILHIISCDLLECIFGSSVLESLRNLEVLTVKECKAMHVIVKEDGEHTTALKVVVFRRLKSLTLADLPNLKGFLLGMEGFRFEWPLLDEVTIEDCPQMIKFTRGQCITPNLKYIHTAFGKHSLECGLNFDLGDETILLQSSTMCHTTPQGPQPINLSEFPWSLSNLIQVQPDQDSSNEFLRRHILFHRNELHKLQILEKLQLDYLWNTQEVFGTTQGQGTDEGVNETEELFETTQGQGTDEDVNEMQTVVTFPNLKEVILIHMTSLRCLWKSHQWITLNFPNLTKVSIKDCEPLNHVFTHDTVGSLLKLQELQVTKCKNMKLIIKEREDYETEVNKIVFPCLKSLTLAHLDSLKGFSMGMEPFELPSLHTLIIKDCPEIMSFTSQESITPELKIWEKQRYLRLRIWNRSFGHRKLNN